MSSEDGVGDLRKAVQRMIDSADFYASLSEIRHTPTCWNYHTACALRRVLDVLDGEEEE